MDHFTVPLDQPNENGLSGRSAYDGPPWIAAEEIKAMRKYLRITQRQFAGWFGFPAATLRHWERGNRHPTGAALVLLCVIRENPGAVMRAVRRARRLAPGSLPKIEPLLSFRAPPGYGDSPPLFTRRGPQRNKRKPQPNRHVPQRR